MAKHLHSVEAQVSGFINEKETEIKKEGKRERERQTADRQRKRQTEIERQTGFNRETNRER